MKKKTSTPRRAIARLDRDNYAAKSLRQTRAHSLRTSVFEILRIPIDGSVFRKGTGRVCLAGAGSFCAAAVRCPPPSPLICEMGFYPAPPKRST